MARLRSFFFKRSIISTVMQISINIYISPSLCVYEERKKAEKEKERGREDEKRSMCLLCPTYVTR
jgi:hypothetical protein